MKINWSQFIDHTVNVTMNENYGVVHGNTNSEHPNFYEIVFKTGKLIGAFEDGILLQTVREEQHIKVFIPFNSIKCVEIF